MEMKVFLYIRDSIGNNDNLKKQEKELREFVNREFEAATISVYKDIGSVLEEREGLNNLLNDIKKKGANWVIVSHIDRFYKITYEKGMEKLNLIVDEILNNGAGIISVREEKCLKPFKELERITEETDETEEI